MRDGEDDACRNSWQRSSILWQNDEQTVTLLDIPRSIELAQGFDNLHERKILSSEPLERPYASTEPKSAKALAAVKERGIDDLILQRTLELALQEASKGGPEKWCLPRAIGEEEDDCEAGRGAKRKRGSDGQEHDTPEASSSHAPAKKHVRLPYIPETEVEGENRTCLLPSWPPAGHGCQCNKCLNASNAEPQGLARTPFPTNREMKTLYVSDKEGSFIFPPGSCYINGTIEDNLPTFKAHAPRFDLIIMDPPWPNRSVRRAGSYQTSYGTAEMRGLLSSIPVGEKLAQNGLVGVWITNKPVFRELLLGKDGEGGLFEYWGVERLEEWIWLKITSGGEPVTAIGGTWRKPYEILLVGRKLAESKSQLAKGGRDGESHAQSNGRWKKKPEEEQDPEGETPAVRRRIVLAVPDLHSRKPHLAELFRAHFPSPPHSLEIFARSLAADSWSWGDEVLKFQHLSHWSEVMLEAYPEKGAQADGPET